MSAKAGIQNYLKKLDSRLRGKDENGSFKSSIEILQSKVVHLKSKVSSFGVILNSETFLRTAV
jgi:hypothetical protein